MHMQEKVLMQNARINPTS